MEPSFTPVHTLRHAACQKGQEKTQRRVQILFMVLNMNNLLCQSFMYEGLSSYIPAWCLRKLRPRKWKGHTAGRRTLPKPSLCSHGARPNRRLKPLSLRVNVRNQAALSRAQDRDLAILSGWSRAGRESGLWFGWVSPAPPTKAVAHPLVVSVTHQSH